MIDCIATQQVYIDHLAPIWHALQTEGLAGELFCGRAGNYARERHGLAPVGRRPSGRLTLVAAAADLAQTAGPVVMLNHGAGQTYRNAKESSSYTGGPRRERVVANLCPGPADVRACRVAQPDVPAFAVGVPRLDGIRLPDDPGHVGLAWHWACTICPECQPAYSHYEAALPAVAGRWPTLGHGHPRMWRFYTRQYDKLGIESVQHFDDLLAEGIRLLAADNTSVMYEAAYLGIPILALNASGYRRDVHHGLRFWSHVPGLQCDLPDDLQAAIETALTDPPEARRLRRAAVDWVYGGPKRGPDTPRAVAAIAEVIDGRPT